MTGFYTHQFSASMALCDGGAYLLSVAALPSLPPKDGGYSFTTPIYAHVVGNLATTTPNTKFNTKEIETSLFQHPRMSRHVADSHKIHNTLRHMLWAKIVSEMIFLKILQQISHNILKKTKQRYYLLNF